MTRRHAVFLGLLLIPMAGLIMTTSSAIIHWPGKDEGYYLSYATSIACRGLAGFPVLFRHYLEHTEEMRLFPPPLRVAPMFLGALAVRLGGANFQSLVWLSFAALAVLLIVSSAYVARHYGTRTAVWTTLLLAASPLSLAMAQRALADSLLAAIEVIALWIAVEMLVDSAPARRVWWPRVAFLGAAALLVKEEAVVLIPIVVGLAVYQGWRVRRLSGVWRMLLACAAALGLATILIVVAAGSPARAWETLRIHLAAVGDNPYARHHGGGPWFRYLVDQLLLSPWVTILGLAWAGYLFGSRLRDDPARLWALVPALFFLCAAPFTKNAQYALFLEFPMRFGAVRMLQTLVGGDPAARRTTVVMLALVLGLILLDVHAFYRIFVHQGVDPLTEWLLMKRGILPALP